MNNLTPNKKEKLKKILNFLETDEEKDAKKLIDKIFEIENSLLSLSLDNKNTKSNIENELNSLSDKIEKTKKLSSKLSNKTEETFNSLIEKLIEKFEDLKVNLKPKDPIDRDYSISYKKMLEELSAINSKVGGWRYPQYAYTGIRDKSFSSINPAEGVRTTIYNGITTCSTSAIQLSTEAYSLGHGILLKSHNANAGIVYVGSSDVADTNGFELQAGESMTIPVDAVSKIYIISSISSAYQEIGWIAN